jgi:hypothetical protein
MGMLSGLRKYPLGYDGVSKNWAEADMKFNTQQKSITVRMKHKPFKN